MDTVLPKHIFVNKLKMYLDQCIVFHNITKQLPLESSIQTNKLFILQACIEELIDELEDYVTDHEQFQYSIYN